MSFFKENLTKLILSLVILGIVGWYAISVEYQKQKKEIEKIEKKGLLFDVKKEDINEIKIQRGEKEDIVISKEGKNWYVKKPVNAPGDEGNIKQILNKLTSARFTEQLKDADPSQYGLDKPYLKITFKTKDGGKHWISFGKKNSFNSNYYAMLSKKAGVVMVPAHVKNTLDKKIFDIRRKNLLSFNNNDIKKIDVTYFKTSYILMKEKKDWILKKPVELQADRSTVSTLLASIRGIRAKSFLDDKKDIDKILKSKPVAKVVLIDKNGKESAISVYENKKDLFAKVTGYDWLAEVEKKSLEKLKKTPKDLRNRQLFNFDTKKVYYLAVNKPGESYMLKKVMKDEKKNIYDWVLENPKKNRGIIKYKVNSMVSDIRYLRAIDFIDSPKSDRIKFFASGKEKGEIILQDKDKKELAHIYVDTKIDETNPYGAKSGFLVKKSLDDKTIYVISESVINRIKWDLDDILKKSEKTPNKESKK